MVGIINIHLVALKIIEVTDSMNTLKLDEKGPYL